MMHLPYASSEEELPAQQPPVVGQKRKSLDRGYIGLTEARSASRYTERRSLDRGSRLSTLTGLAGAKDHWATEVKEQNGMCQQLQKTVEASLLFSTSARPRTASMPPRLTGHTEATPREVLQQRWDAYLEAVQSSALQHQLTDTVASLQKAHADVEREGSALNTSKCAAWQQQYAPSGSPLVALLTSDIASHVLQHFAISEHAALRATCCTLRDWSSDYLKTLRSLNKTTLVPACQYPRFVSSALGVATRLCGRGITRVELGDDTPGAKLGVSGPMLAHVLRSCPNLHTLALSSQATPDTVQAICEWGGKLSNLDLSNCQQLSDMELAHLPERCSLLSRIDFSGMRNVGDATICAVAAHCSGLQSLDVNATAVTDASLVLLAQHCKDLKCLDVSQTVCNGITDYGIGCIAQGCHKLQELSVGCQSGVSHASMVQLAWHCPELLSLDAADTHGSHATLESLLNRCKYIKSLNISGWADLSDHSLVALSKDAPWLEHFHASGHTHAAARARHGQRRFSMEGLVVLAKGCAHLRSVFVSGMLNLDGYLATKQITATFKSHCPDFEGFW